MKGAAETDRCQGRTGLITRPPGAGLSIGFTVNLTADVGRALTVDFSVDDGGVVVAPGSWRCGTDASSGGEDPIPESLKPAIACRMSAWEGPVTVAQSTCINRLRRVRIRHDVRTGVVRVAGQTRMLIEGML